jgi:hypothetical protein
MNELTTVAKDIVLTKTLGLPTLKRLQYTDEQVNYLLMELSRLATARQEVFSSEVISEWINTFMDINLDFATAVAKVRMCKSSKMYGKTTLGDILESETEVYHKYYIRA